MSYLCRLYPICNKGIPTQCNKISQKATDTFFLWHFLGWLFWLPFAFLKILWTQGEKKTDLL